jgi:3-isopropylmalate dehydratase small subunit
MGAKNAVFPADEVLSAYIGSEVAGIWADKDASYALEIKIDLAELYPLVAAPHHVDNVMALSVLKGLEVHEGLIGTCTSGRLEDLREAAAVLKGEKVHKGFQLLVIPASRAIYLQAVKEGLVTVFLEAGANVLSASCGPCLGTGQGIPADGSRVISTANRNFAGRMGNINAEIYLASPVAVALAAIHGKITDPRPSGGKERFPYSRLQTATVTVPAGSGRRSGNVWDYRDADHLNTDLMFAGHLTYKVLSSDGEGILKHLFGDFDPAFAKNVERGDIILAGENFGCGSSREHPAVGLAHAGVAAVIVKSVNRIFYRAAINQGLTLLVVPEAVSAYRKGDCVTLMPDRGLIKVGEKEFAFQPLPGKLLDILNNGGLVSYLSNH